MSKKKFYVVWEGKNPGIYSNWEECKDNILGFQGAKYKSFLTLENAKKAFDENYFDHAGKKNSEITLSAEELNLIGLPIKNSVCVDAACSGNPGVMEYQGIDLFSKQKLFRKGPFKNATINIGEFLAIVHALAFLHKKNDFRPIYSDSRNAISWIKNKRINTTLQKNIENNDVFELVDRALIWLRENPYKNKILKWETKAWGENPADFGRK